MPTSNYMPDVVVEVDFANVGFTTSKASRTWTDVSAYVELAKGMSVEWGRKDESSTADPNQLTLTLDNSDGRFTAGLATGPYHPLKIGRAIRVRVDPVDGADVTYFSGFVNAWPTEWSEGTSAYASATITASSRLSRIGTQAGLKSIVEAVILADSPVAYYTLGEPADSTQANDSSGTQAAPIVLGGDATLPMVFGTATGPETDGLTAAQFVAGQYLVGNVANAGTGNSYTLEGFFLRDGVPLANEGIFGAMQVGGGEGIVVYLEAATGKVVVGGKTLVPTPPTLVTSSSNYADGATHHLMVTRSNTTITVYVDGVNVGTVAVTGTALPATLAAGNSDNWGALTTLTGVVAHLALFATALNSTQAAAHANAGLNGYAGESTSVRLVRYAALAGIPAGDVTAETGSTTMQHVDTTGQQVVEMMRVCETTEGGVLFDSRDGSLTFHNRAHRYASSSIYTLNVAEQEVEAGYAPRVDLTGLANDITGTDITGAYTAHVFDGPGAGTSISEYGYATATIETASQDKDEPLNLANWNLYEFKDPKERAPNLEVDALAQVGQTPNCSAVLATTVGDKVTVSNRPAQAASSSVDYFVEGGTAVFGPESLTITFNASPSYPYDRVLVVDDAVRGVIDTNVIGL